MASVCWYGGDRLRQLGRVVQQSNPYLGNSSGTGTRSHWTTSTYDLLSRATVVTLPDDSQSHPSKIVTVYSGATATLTDQVGRQRKSELDGLGRLIKVTEQDPASGSLSQLTTYGYDVFDNLTLVTQGTQTRSYKYDALSRLIYEKISEQDATIIEAAGSWSCKYTYFDFGGLESRKDARGVVTNYIYDMSMLKLFLPAF